MKKLIFTVLLTGFLICPLLAQSKVTSEEYRIYAAVLKEIYKRNLKDTKQDSAIVVLDKTVKPEFFDYYVGRKIKGLRKDFRQKNETIVNLEKSFPLKYKNYVVSRNELDRLLKIGGENAKRIRIENEKNKKLLAADSTSEVIWEPFYEKFPRANGYYNFSRIGFNSTKRFAVIQVYGEGAYWTSDETYVLMKTKKGWGLYTSSGGFSIA